MGVAGEATTADKPKKHSAFMQVILRKSGEAMDLGGKGLLGFSGLGQILQAKARLGSDPGRAGVEVLLGGMLLLTGIYLQAKAEETA